VETLYPVLVTPSEDLFSTNRNYLNIFTFLQEKDKIINNANIYSHRRGYPNGQSKSRIQGTLSSASSMISLAPMSEEDFQSLRNSARENQQDPDFNFDVSKPTRLIRDKPSPRGLIQDDSTTPEELEMDHHKPVKELSIKDVQNALDKIDDQTTETTESQDEQKIEDDYEGFFDHPIEAEVDAKDQPEIINEITIPSRVERRSSFKAEESNEELAKVEVNGEVIEEDIPDHDEDLSKYQEEQRLIEEKIIQRSNSFKSTKKFFQVSQILGFF
jgi:hypothetical protein